MRLGSAILISLALLSGGFFHATLPHSHHSGDIVWQDLHEAVFPGTPASPLSETQSSFPLLALLSALIPLTLKNQGAFRFSFFESLRRGIFDYRRFT